MADSEDRREGLTIEEAGTERAYFAHNGKPLLSFGGMADVTFYLNLDAYDYKRWAAWMAEHGMNHIHAYLPLSWKHVEKTTEINGGDVSKCLFPYKETEPGSRIFDLDAFDERTGIDFGNSSNFWKRRARSSISWSGTAGSCVLRTHPRGRIARSTGPDTFQSGH